MAIRSGFFNSNNGDRTYDANRFAEYFASFIGNGVFPNPSDNLQVTSNNDTTVSVRPGKAWIDGYIMINTDDYILNLEIADGVLSRIDRIVIRYDVAQRDVFLEVKQGNYASSPVAPSLQRDADAYELALADISVSNGITSITQANITDTRLSSELCGIVHGTVEQVDAESLFQDYQSWINQKKTEYNQDLIEYITSKNNELNNWYYSTTTRFEDDFNAWFDTIRDLLDESIEGNLLSEMEKLKHSILRDRKEILDIKLKLSESNVTEFLNKTGIGFYDLFQNLNYVDTNLTTASVNVTENEVSFNGDKLLKMKEQQFDNFNNLELAIYDKDRESINVSESSVNNQIEVLITPSSVDVGDKYIYNNEIYTVSTVSEGS